MKKDSLSTNKSSWGRKSLDFKTGDSWLPKNRICFAIVIKRPKNKIFTLEEETQEAEAQESMSKCNIKRPIAPHQYVDSVVHCQVGDIIILEGDEELYINNSTQPHGICFPSNFVRDRMEALIAYLEVSGELRL